MDAASVAYQVLEQSSASWVGFDELVRSTCKGKSEALER